MSDPITAIYNGFRRLFGLNEPSTGSPRAHAEHPALYLNVGSGSDYRKGYVNIDIDGDHHPDIQCDAACLREIEDGSCEQVLAKDVLEHIGRHHAITALREWNRVLRINGMLLLRVPSLVDLLGLLQHPEWQGYPQQKELIRRLYGNLGEREGVFLNGYTETTLRHELVEAGFTITRLQVVDGWMFDVAAVKHRHMPPDPLLAEPSDQEFVTQAYLRELGEEPDEQALQAGLDALAAGADREMVLADIQAKAPVKVE